ncbi:MAG: hypothetical protein ACUVTR_04395 [Dehalococcoidia bacterium]
MPYCQYCGRRVRKDAVSCPRCGQSLVLEMSRAQEKIEQARDRANIYLILATVLVTVGIIGSGLLFASASPLGLFGVAFVCLGVGCTSVADRHEHEAQNLKEQLPRRR